MTGSSVLPATPAAQAKLRTSRRTVRYYDQVFWDVAESSPAG